MPTSRLLNKESSAGTWLLLRSGLLWMVAALVLASCASCAGVPSSGGEQAAKQIAARIEQLERVLKAAPASEQTAYELQRLQRSRRALEAGYLYASLYDLQPLMVENATRQYTESKRELDQAGFDVFDREWQSVGPQLSQQDKSLTKAGVDALPAAVRALVQSAQEQSRSLYQSARLYGRETTTPYGLHYIGQAKGFMDFAVWSAGLAFPRGPAGPVARAPEKEIAALERELLQSYQRPDATKQQGQFNEVSAQLKFAGDLNQQGKPLAALQTYLEASLMFGLMDAPSVNASDLDKLQKQGQQLKARFNAGPHDQSVGRMYWEVAENNLAVPAGDKSSERAAQRAAIILEKVLPRYFQYSEGAVGPAAPVAAATAPGNARVRVTLVRWPYT